MSSAFFTDRVNTPDVPEDDPYLILNETTTPRPEFTRHSGSRFYNRARLVTVEELHHPTTRSRVAESRRGPRASDPRDTTSRRSRKGGIRSTSSRESNPKRSPSRHSSNTSRKSNRTTTTTTNKRKTNDDYRSQSYSSRQTSKTKHGNDDIYDAYPWSAYYRDQVMVLNKFPKPPYFLQLPSGKRPDTIVLRNIPVSWFLDTPEEVKLEKERERRETKVTTYPGHSHHNGEATDVTLEPDSDSPFWFTKHGHIIVKAACMKFGAIRRVDLVFEMESRDEEWSLCFDAYVQFKYFQGFRDCYIAFDGAVLLHHKDDADDYDTTATATTPSTTTQSGQQENRPMQKNKEKKVEALYLVPEFDISEHFSDHQVKLRKVRKEMEEKKRNQEEYLIKRNNLKLKKQYKETVINLHKALKKMNNDMEDVEIYLTRLLDMTSETEAEELKQKEEEKEASKWGSNEAEASSKYNEEYREGKEEHEQRKEEKNKEETWDDATTPAPATRSSNVFIAATEDARECMRTATEYINGLPNTGESTVDIVTGELAGALTLVPAAKKHLSLLNKSIKHANSIVSFFYNYGEHEGCLFFALVVLTLGIIVVVFLVFLFSSSLLLSFSPSLLLSFRYFKNIPYVRCKSHLY